MAAATGGKGVGRVRRPSPTVAGGRPVSRTLGRREGRGAVTFGVSKEGATRTPTGSRLRRRPV